MIKFEFNGKIYYADNLQKKLKRLKTTEDKISIIDDNFDFIKKDKYDPDDLEDMYTYAYVYDKSENKVIVTIVENLHIKPNLHDLFDKNIWNKETKTGWKNIIDKEYIDFNMILLDGIPKFPLEFLETGLIKLIKEYNWK